jgi:hypothetical protein
MGLAFFIAPRIFSNFINKFDLSLIARQVIPCLPLWFDLHESFINLLCMVSLSHIRMIIFRVKVASFLLLLWKKCKMNSCGLLNLQLVLCSTKINLEVRMPKK